MTEENDSHRAVVEAGLPPYRTAGTLRHALNASRKPSGKGDATKGP